MHVDGVGEPNGAERNETEAQRIDRNWIELLQELRIVQTALGLPAQLAQIFGHPVEAEPPRQTVRRFDPSIGAYE